MICSVMLGRGFCRYRLLKCEVGTRFIFLLGWWLIIKRFDWIGSYGVVKLNAMHIEVQPYYKHFCFTVVLMTVLGALCCVVCRLLTFDFDRVDDRQCLV